jgi:hypothetical protein
VRLKILCGVIAVGAMIAIPVKATALTTLGPTAPPAAFNVGTGGSAQTDFNTVAPAGIQLTAPANGIITRFRTAADKTATLRIIRKSGANYIGAGTGPEVPALGAGVQVTTETHMPIAAGDTIGMNLPAGAILGGTETGWTLTLIFPPIPDGGPPQPASNSFGGWLAFVSADFELDEDHDNFGDDTQDKCVGSAGPFNGCPSTVVIDTAKQKGKKPKVAVTATVPGAGTLKAGSANDASLASASASMSLKAVSQTITSTSKQQVTLTLKLTKSAKKKLADKGKLKTSVKVVYTPSGGPPASQTAKVKLKS